MWWAAKLNDPNSVAQSGSYSLFQIKSAINARRIMSDNLTTITATNPRATMLYNIWFPDHAEPVIYKALARIRPDMLYSCLRACIVADYRDTWSRLWSLLVGAPPIWDKEQLDQTYTVMTRPLYGEACDSRDPGYLSDISSVPGLVGRCKPRTEPSGWEDVLTASKRPNGQPSGRACGLCIERPLQNLCHGKGVFDGAWLKTSNSLSLLGRWSLDRIGGGIRDG